MTDRHSNQALVERLRALEGKKIWLMDSGEWRIEPPTEDEAEHVKKESHIWYQESPGEAVKLQALEQVLDVTFPEAYRQLLLYSDGGELGSLGSSIYFFPLHELSSFDELFPEHWTQNLPDMIIFGNDTGDYIYYFDPENRLGYGTWAVYAVEMGCADFDSSIFVANDIAHLVERILNGEPILDGPYLKDEQRN